jgi:2-dehydro-3-deoxygluconokinase
MLLSSFAFASCEEKEYVTEISSVKIKDDEVTLKATLDESYAEDEEMEFPTQNSGELTNEEDASDVFGIKADNTDITSGKLSHDGYKSVAKKLVDTFGFKKVAITLRGSISANDNNWAAMLYDGKDFYFSKNYLIHIVDRVGGGDSFGGGLIYALLNNFSMQDTIEFAVAASCLKHTIEGDYNMVSVDEVLKLAQGDGSGRVQR